MENQGTDQGTNTESTSFDDIHAGHSCTIIDKDHPITRHITDGVLVRPRRTLKTLTLVDFSNPFAKWFFRSKAQLNMEADRHLKHFYYMVHPFSKLTMFREYFMLSIFTGVMFAYPFHLYSSEDIHNRHRVDPWKIVLDVICTINILLSFNTGYLSKQRNKVVLDRKEVTKHYLKTWFALDVVCTFNYKILLMSFESMALTIRFLNYVKFLRIINFFKLLNRLKQYTNLNVYKFNFFKLLLVTLALLIWLTSFMHLLGVTFNETWAKDTKEFKTIVSILYRVTYLYFLVGYGEGRSSVSAILIFEMMCWTLGMTMRFLILAEIVKILRKYKASTNKYHQRIQRLKDFIRSKGLPEVTCNRIILYFEFRFQKSFYEEKNVLSTLSQQLEKEIMLHSCKSFIQNVIIFQDLPTGLLMNIVACMKSVIYLPNDVIVQAGTPGSNMFFIYNGTVAVYAMDGQEICHLGDGSNFGEISLVIENTRRVASVVAVDSCELYILNKEDFHFLIRPYPELLERMLKTAKYRLAQVTFVEQVLGRL